MQLAGWQSLLGAQERTDGIGARAALRNTDGLQEANGTFRQVRRPGAAARSHARNDQFAEGLT